MGPTWLWPERKQKQSIKFTIQLRYYNKFSDVSEKEM